MSPKTKLLLFRIFVVAPSILPLLAAILPPYYLWIAAERVAESVHRVFEGRIFPWIDSNIGDRHLALKKAAQDSLKKPGIFPGRNSDPTSWGVE